MKIDLHVHSKHSKRPSQWVLKKIDCPESFTDPLHLHDVAVQRGMSLVTITDHNTIDGALEIAHLPDTFVSEEITSYFPEDGCKVHVLAYAVNEAQHREIQKLRPSVFDLVPYLCDQNIVHAVAHPLYSINDRLTAEHFEKMLLLFKIIELNGSRDDYQNQLIQWIVSHLNAADIDRLADKHDLEPLHEAPWQKALIGGSDDHSSLNIARRFTEVKGATTLKAFLEGLRSARSCPGGRSSTPLTLSHNLYAIAYQFYKNKFHLERYVQKDLFLRLLDRFLQGSRHGARLWSRLIFLMPKRKSCKVESGGRIQEMLRYEAHRMICGDPELMDIVKHGNGHKADMEQKWYDFVNRISNRVVHHFGDHVLDHLSGANVFNLFSSAGSAGALYSLLAPYFVSFSLFSRERQLTDRIGTHFKQQKSIRDHSQQPINVAHFTDTFYEVNGVALTLQQQVRIARKTGKKLTVMTCDTEEGHIAEGVRNFKPIGVYELPVYREQRLFYPPFLEMLNYCYEQRFDRINTATPGPIGLAALGIARILNLPISGTYHTSLPQYAGCLTRDSAIEELMWKYVLWFYRQLDFIYVPSRSTARELAQKGVQAEKIRIFPRGIDIQRFHPAKRDSVFIRKYADDVQFKLLYVGRISKEKNLPLLARIFRSICRHSQRPVSLIVAGDGPYLEEMQAELADTPARFTGYLHGDSLAKLYASCDLFVFPSTTDTFGNVVLEAQASGLPVLVADKGGPQENLIPGETGLVVSADQGQAMQEAIQTLLQNPIRLKQMSKAARRYMENRSFDHAFQETWEMYQDSVPASWTPRFAFAKAV